MEQKAASDWARLALALALVLSWLLFGAASQVEDEKELFNLGGQLGGHRCLYCDGTAAGVFQEFVVADIAVNVARSALEAAKDVGQGQQQQ
jgi:hypothetical protein